MPKESVVFGLAGVFFGILVGWMIGSQQARPPAATTSAPPAAAQQAQTAPPFDQSRATALEATIAANASDVESRVQLGDLYFDAERFADAVKWYEDALRIEAAARKVTRPMLLVAGDDDPYALRSARDLQKAGGGPRELLILKQAGHGTAMLGRDPTLAGALVDWFRRTLL